MELAIIIASYILVFGMAAIVAAVPAVLIWYALKQKVKRRWCYFAGLVLTLCVLVGLCHNPLLLYGKGCEQNLSPEQTQAIRNVSCGVYSKRMPLIPIVICVDRVEDRYVAWTENYFPVGTRKLEYAPDGYNTIKYLPPW